MWLLYLVLKMPENDRNNVLRGKHALKKVPLLFLDVKKLQGRFDRRF